jgi:hypothetical protein
MPNPSSVAKVHRTQLHNFVISTALQLSSAPGGSHLLIFSGSDSDCQFLMVVSLAELNVASRDIW